MAVASAVPPEPLFDLPAVALNAVQRLQTATPTGMCLNEAKLSIADVPVAGKRICVQAKASTCSETSIWATDLAFPPR